MKITIVTGPFFPVPEIRGGAIPRIWRGLAETFAQKGHSVHIVACHHHDQPDQETIRGVHYQRFGGFSQSRCVYWNIVRDFFYALGTFFKLPESDILIVNDFWLPALSSLKKSLGKTILICQRTPKHQFFLYPKTAAIVLPSLATQKTLLKQAPSFSSKSTVIPNPVDPSFFQTSGSTNKKVIFAGRLHREKGVPILIEAFHKLSHNHPDASLQIIGPWKESEGGSGKSYYEELLKAAEHSNVSFHEPIFDPQELSQIYQSASVFCYPSLAESGETFGLAVLEAMASELLPIVSDLSCFKDFIAHQRNGLIFNHRENPVYNLTQNLEQALTTDISSMRKTSLETALDHSLDKIAENYINFFTKLLHEHA